MKTDGSLSALAPVIQSLPHLQPSRKLSALGSDERGFDLLFNQPVLYKNKEIYFYSDILDNDKGLPADIVAQPDPLVRPLLHQARVGVHDELEDLGPLQT